MSKYLYNTTTYKASGIIDDNDTPPAGTADAGTAYTDGRMEWAGGTGPWTLPDSAKSDDERAWRDNELVKSDWTQLPDVDLTAQQVTDWADYRQELRDMPTLTGFPNTHTRPSAPS